MSMAPSHTRNTADEAANGSHERLSQKGLDPSISLRRAISGGHDEDWWPLCFNARFGAPVLDLGLRYEGIHY